MQYIRCPVGTLAVGQAASMASLLLAAGEVGHRRTLPHRWGCRHRCRFNCRFSSPYSGQPTYLWCGWWLLCYATPLACTPRVS